MTTGFRRLLSALGLVCAVLSVPAMLGCSAWRVFFPKKDYDEERPELPADLGSPAILIFSKTNGFRHEEAIPAGIEAMQAIAARRGWSTFATENGAVHNPEQLARFDALVWHNVSGDVLTEEQRAALRSYLEKGGGFVGIHGSGGDPSYKWDWYVETLIGAQFAGHPMKPQFQEATIHVEDRGHAATRHLGPTWVRTDEWYSFEKSPRGEGVRVLASLDESTYSPRMKIWWMDRDLAMGSDHPIIWSHCVGQGRVLYSALGHQASAYSEPEHRKMLEGAIAWAAGLDGADCAHPISPR